jgi:hypothetical protein
MAALASRKKRHEVEVLQLRRERKSEKERLASLKSRLDHEFSRRRTAALFPAAPGGRLNAA